MGAVATLLILFVTTYRNFWGLTLRNSFEMLTLLKALYTHTACRIAKKLKCTLSVATQHWWHQTIDLIIFILPKSAISTVFGFQFVKVPSVSARLRWNLRRKVRRWSFTTIPPPLPAPFLLRGLSRVPVPFAAAERVNGLMAFLFLLSDFGVGCGVCFRLGFVPCSVFNEVCHPPEQHPTTANIPRAPFHELSFDVRRGGGRLNGCAIALPPFARARAAHSLPRLPFSGFSLSVLKVWLVTVTDKGCQKV